MQANDYILISLLTLLCIVAVATVKSRDLIKSTILLSAFSLIMALTYILLLAPDVAITEAAIGGGISTLLFIAAISLIGRDEAASKYKYLSLSSGLLALVFIVSLLLIVPELPIYGTADAPIAENLSSWYIENAPIDTGIPNMVTSILASYRGFDTMGEVFVVFTAGISVRLILAKD